MKFRVLLAGTSMLATAFVMQSAFATTFNWSYSGDGVSAGGTLTADLATGNVWDVSSIGGTRTFDSVTTTITGISNYWLGTVGNQGTFYYPVTGGAVPSQRIRLLILDGR